MLDLSLYNNIIVDDVLDACIQELDILFCTYNTELIGYPQYGTNFDQFLWTLTPTTSELRTYILDKMGELFFTQYVQYDVDVQYVDDSKLSDEPMYYATIVLTYKSIQKTKIYRFIQS